jgi:hypothetical protein
MNFGRYVISIVKCSIKRERDFMVLNTVSRISSFEYSSVYKILAFLLFLSRFPFTHYRRNREHPKWGTHAVRTSLCMVVAIKAICNYCGRKFGCYSNPSLSFSLSNRENSILYI